MGAVTIFTYATAPEHGPESIVEYATFEDAAAVAQRGGLQVIEKRYEFADSGLVADFTRYHWLLIARCEGDDVTDLYRPGGPDLCCDSPAEALDNLVERLTRVLRDLGRCDGGAVEDPYGQCAACRGYESVYGALRALADVDPDDVEEHGYECAVAADPQVPVVYRITQILATECVEDNHR